MSDWGAGTCAHDGAEGAAAAGKGAGREAGAGKAHDGILILGIETSCDETAAAVVRDGREILSNAIYSQIDIHEVYGGVVPEIAARNHIEKIDLLIQQALREAGIGFQDLSAIAVTYGPGLVGALLVGVAEAKALSYALEKPLVGVHHIEGHIAANYLEHPDLEPPFACLVVSGGHTHLVEVEDYGRFSIIGRSRDDAAGEAFDKVARALGLGYPGGPKVDKAARQGNPAAIHFPRGQVDGFPYDFTFSGLKSAVLNYLNQQKMRCDAKSVQAGRESAAEVPDALLVPATGGSMPAMVPPVPSVSIPDICASFQEAVTDALVSRAVGYCREKGIKKLAMAGGVSANSHIRERMEAACRAENIRFFCPRPLLCTDNAAMIASAAFYEFAAGRRDGLELNAVPNLRIGER